MQSTIGWRIDVGRRPTRFSDNFPYRVTPTAPHNARTMTVVLVGHKSPVRERLIADLCELEGVVVIVREPGARDVQSAVFSRDADAVLVDMQQARAGGLELIRAIRDARPGRAPAIIALSSSTSIQYRVKCHEAGATFFFGTAGDQESLLGALRAMRQEIDARPAAQAGEEGRQPSRDDRGPA